MRKSTAKKVQRSVLFGLDYWCLLSNQRARRGKKKNRLITFVIVQEKNSFVHIAWGLSVIKMLLLDPGPDSAKVLLMWVILHCMNSLVGLLTWIKITSMTKGLQVQALHTGRGCRYACVCVSVFVCLLRGGCPSFWAENRSQWVTWKKKKIIHLKPQNLR